MFFKKFKWQHYVLVAIVILAFFLNFWMLYKEGYSNEYYAAAVKSMMSNIQAFFFGSFDSGLYVTVDKPPLGLWIQTLSSAIFGVNSFGLILPSALAGCMSALLVYCMIKNTWGETAGIIGAGIMTTTPILVALSRTNNMDSMLLFFLLCGASFIIKAAKRQSLKYYILAMIFVGLGFNIKMLQAFLVLPAFLIIYFLGKGKLLNKIFHTIIATIVLAVVSFSWMVVVDSIPASNRPYIGSSGTNSVLNLTLGYNGIQRLVGNQGSGIGNNSAGSSYFVAIADATQLPTDATLNSEFSAPTDAALNGEFLVPNDAQANIGSQESANSDSTRQPPNGNDGKQNGSFDGTNQLDGSRSNDGPGMGNQGGAGGVGESGTQGIFRLYTSQLAGLISWFLLPAVGMMILCGVCFVYWFVKRKTMVLTDEMREKFISVAFWSAWLLPMAVFFSIGGFVHRYYVVMLCPAIAALTAVAVVLAFRSAHKKWLVPLCFAATLAVQCFIVSRTSWIWLAIPMAACEIIGIALFFARHKVLKIISAILMAVALFIAPLAWSLTPVLYTINSTIPNAGPDAVSTEGIGGMIQNLSLSKGTSDSSVLYDYLLANYNGERWAIAVSSSSEAEPIILETGLPVMAIGGFSGNDSILTLDKLKEYVASGELRYYMASSRSSGSSEITTWVQENGTVINLSNEDTIYDLKSTK